MYMHPEHSGYSEKQFRFLLLVHFNIVNTLKVQAQLVIALFVSTEYA